MDWKKEYKVSDLIKKENGSAEPAEQAAPRQAPQASENPWKKEISFSLFRRKKEPKQRGLPQIGDTVREGQMPAGQREVAQPESSVWKKEIKLSTLFRRKREQKQPKQQLALPAAGGTVAEAPTGPVASHPYPSQPAQAAAAAAAASEQPAGPAPAAETPAAPVAEQPATEPAPAPSAPSPGPEAAGEPEPAPAPAPPAPVADTQVDEPPAAEPASDRRSKRGGPEKRERAERPERKPRGSSQLPQVPLMKALNLMPQDIKLPKTTMRPWVAYAAVGAVAVLVAGGMGFLYMNERDHIADRQSQLEDMDAQLAALAARAAQAQAEGADGSALAGEAQTRATALSFALDGRRGWDRLLRELSLTLPENVWFSSMISATTAPTPTLPPEAGATTTPVAPTPVTSSLTITGYALTQEDVAELLARLEVVPEFNSIQLESATQTDVGEQSVIEFSVIGALKQPVQVTP